MFRRFSCKGEAVALTREFEGGKVKNVGVIACGGIEGDMGTLGDLRTVHVAPEAYTSSGPTECLKAAEAALKAHCSICPINPNAVKTSTFVPGPDLKS